MPALSSIKKEKQTATTSGYTKTSNRSKFQKFDYESDSDGSQDSWNTTRHCQDSSETNDGISEDSDDQESTGGDEKGGNVA